MTRTKPKSFLRVVLESLGWPMFWGMTATVGFYYLMSRGFIQDEFVLRYFAGHPVEYVETAMFFIAAAALTLKCFNLMHQFSVSHQVELAAPPSKGNTPADCESLLESLGKLPHSVRSTYLVKRIESALGFVQRKDHADELDDELRFLSEMDVERAHESYSLVRIIVWATPMLGFLGTVIGITLALGNLSPESLVNSPQTAMEGLLAGLSVAFDTTALALSLSILLMFIQFLVQQAETQLLSWVDRRTVEELAGRFQQVGGGKDPLLVSVRQMSASTLSTTEKLVEQQSELWKDAMAQVHSQWNELLGGAGEQIQSGVAAAMSDGMKVHGEHLRQIEQAAEHRSDVYWQKLQRSIAENAEIIIGQQEQMQQLGDTLREVVEATAEVTRLENSLNKNLQALAGSKNFEDTVMSLSAAIHLLNSRLSVSQPKTVKKSPSGKAA